VSLWRRMVLTYRYRGPRSVAVRIVTFPLRATPLRTYLPVDRLASEVLISSRRWYRSNRRPVALVIAGADDDPQVVALIRSVRRTTRRGSVRIIVAGDTSSGVTHAVARCFEAGASPRDVVLLRPPAQLTRDWLAVLQYEAYTNAERVGIVGGKVLLPDGRIASAGLACDLLTGRIEARYSGARGAHGPASVRVPVLAVAPDGAYIRRALLDEIGGLDTALELDDAIVALCARCWHAGWEIRYAPDCILESAAPGRPAGTASPEAPEPARRTFRLLDRRSVRTASGALRIIYVTETALIGGGHRDVFEHLNALAARGHEVALYTLGTPPDWFDLHAPVSTFADYDAIAAALAPVDAIKVATWWKTAAPVWLGSVQRGIPVYLVQDIETSYYPWDQASRFKVLASYRKEFRYMTISTWNRGQLRELGADAAMVPPGVDSNTFHPSAATPRRADMVLAIGRMAPLKNFALTLDAWRGLAQPRPELRLFGVQPESAHGTGLHYEDAPSDQRVAELFREAAVFVQTSDHEGFCLPVLEAMACGTPVVCTDADGNRDFCVDGENCLMPAARADDVRDAIARVLGDERLRERLTAAGLQTAAEYRWEPQLAKLERFFEDLVSPPRAARAAGGAAPAGSLGSAR